MNEEFIYFTVEDIDWLISQFKTPLEQFFWTANVFKFPLSKEIFINHLSYANKQNSVRYCFKYLIDGKLVGYCELNNIDNINNSATISRVIIDKNLRNKGYAFKMLENLIRFAINEKKFFRLELLVLEDNISAINCYRKLNFRIDGVLRASRYFEEKYYNAIIMSLLSNEITETL